MTPEQMQTRAIQTLVKDNIRMRARIDILTVQLKRALEKSATEKGVENE